ncbi:hypothetical protein J1605_008526 [Eschrichtius robustus]|uniref:Uncharacterized protein n=1 Tax=Eschrichtius robustus TaxID=9764 RepID=A0AB34GUQ0_ESCRO|nr:hypothetical protein J1605_008526 [Eschrichtius robustus]
MNPFGRGLPPIGLRGRRKGGVGPGRPQIAPQADPAATRPPRSQGPSPLRHRGDPGFPGCSPKPPPRGPYVDDALARASPRAHRAQSRPCRRLRRTAPSSGRTLLRQKNFSAWSGGNGNRPKKETKTPPSHTCWLPRLYLHSRSPLVTPGAVHRAEGGRGEAAPKRLRTYGGRKGPEAAQPVTAASLTVSPRGREDRVRSGGRRAPSRARQKVDAAGSD